MTFMTAMRTASMALFVLASLFSPTQETCSLMFAISKK